MPIYEYQCASCGTRSEHLMRLSDPDPSECPGCDKPKLQRMLSAPQFRLAGGGWYETDFKGDKDKKRNLAGSDGGSGGDGSSSSSAGSDAKSSDSKPSTGTTAPPASAPASSSGGASSSTATSTPKTGTSGS
jgi:putative FmdB family regulatory protein